MQGSTIQEEDVVWCYREILGRHPESAAAVQSHLASVKDFRSLVSRFIRSQEHWQKMAPRDFVPLDRPEMDIDIAASATELPLMLDGIREAWTHLGRVRPHHSVLTSQEYLPDSINGESIERFYASGAAGAATITAILRRYGFSDLQSKVCVEYGCGLGRMTLALATIFKKVHGYDISANHLTLAERRAADTGIHNVDFHLCSADSGIEHLENCDFFCSYIVFQHNPPPIIRALIGAALGSLRPGGIAVFQVPTYQQGYTFRIKEYLARPPSLDMEMHCIPQHVVFSLIAAAQCKVLEVREDGWIGGGQSISNTFVVQRLSDPRPPRRRLAHLD